MEKLFDVLIVGDINPDILMVDYSRLPNPGEEILVKAAHMALGGGGSICASGLAKLGLDVAIYGFLGNDTFGKIMLENLNNLGINTKFVNIRNDVGTGVSISLTNSQDRAFITYEGTNSLLDVEKIPEEVLQSANHVHVLCYSPQKHDKYVRFFKYLKSLGKTISFDLGYDDTGIWSQRILEIVEIVDIFLPNEKEAINYTRKETAEEALKTFAKVGNTIVVKKGEKGSIAYHDGEYATAESFQVKCVDTTGAGDSFDAGFIYGWLNKFDLEKCLLIGNAVGSKSVQQYGGNTGVPTLDELKLFLSEKNIEI